MGILKNLSLKTWYLNDVMEIQENGVFVGIAHLHDNPQSNSHLDAKGKPHDLTSFSDNLLSLKFK